MNTTVLDNGLKIISNKIEYFRSVHLQFRFKIGSKNDFSNKWGIAHYIEHLIFRNKKEFSKKMAQYGAVYNAETDYEQTILYLDVPVENFYKVLDLFLSLVSNIEFSRMEADSEKQVILTEADIVNSDLYEYGVQEFYHKLLGEYAHPILGTSDSVKGIHYIDLIKFFSKYYTCNNIIIGVAGNIKHEDIVNIVNKYYNISDDITNYSNIDIKLQKEVEHINCDSDLVQLFWGWPAPKEFSKECYEFKVLARIFSGDGTDLWSELFNKCRTELGLCYMIGGIIKVFDNQSIYVINSCTDYQNVQKLIQTVKDVLADLNIHTIKDKIIQSKAMIISELYSIENTLKTIVDDMILRDQYNVSDLTIDEEVEFIKNIEEKDVLHSIENYLTIDKGSLVVIGRKE